MFKFNLTDVLKSDIKFIISKFPDGQQTINITDTRFELEEIREKGVEIVSRLNNFKDLEIILCATQALRNIEVSNVALYTPYFLGSRSDRMFQNGGVNYLKQVICPIINSQNYSKVTVMDPHSDVLEACLNNFHKVNNFQLFSEALYSLIKAGEEDKIVLVSPDAGAYKKVYDVAAQFGINKIITATKVRDMKTGNILRTEIPTLDQINKLIYVIVDDICDGGRTFIELAKVIKDGRPTAKVHLVVTHGIFSAGYAKLGEYIESIYTTNSVKDIGETEYHALEYLKTKVKQLNVF